MEVITKTELALPLFSRGKVRDTYELPGGSLLMVATDRLSAFDVVFPDGIPQERGVGFVYFLNRFGPALVRRLVEELPLDLGRHWILSI